MDESGKATDARTSASPKTCATLSGTPRAWPSLRARPSNVVTRASAPASTRRFARSTVACGERGW